MRDRAVAPASMVDVSRARNEPYVASGDRLISGPFLVVTFTAFAFFTYIGILIPIVPALHRRARSTPASSGSGSTSPSSLSPPSWRAP